MLSRPRIALEPSAAQRQAVGSSAPARAVAVHSATVTDGRPLMAVEAAIFILGVDSETVERHVESGKLAAFNIARPGAKVRCLRIYSVSVIALKNGVDFVIAVQARKLAETIFPPSRASFAIARAAWLIAASQLHVSNLIESRAVRELPRGPRGERSIDGASMLDFLAARRVS